MPAYFIATYDVTDPETFAKYNPGSIETIMRTMTRHGGQLLSAGPDADWLQGGNHVSVVIQFPSVEAAHAWHDDPEYAPAKAIRLSATDNITAFVAPAFDMHG